MYVNVLLMLLDNFGNFLNNKPSIKELAENSTK
jgi:hypothetical protein